MRVPVIEAGATGGREWWAGRERRGERSDAISVSRDELTLLIAGTAKQDRGAFSRLYQASAGKLFSVCLNILGSRALAEEALREAYVNVWRNAASFDPAKGTAMTWLITLARYRALSLRRKAGREVAVDIEAMFAGLADPAPGPLAEAMRGSEAAALRACLDELEGQPREAILLAYFRGLSHLELARHMSVPLGTVKSWIRRSLSRLKGCLDHGPA
ncbi:MAG: sigma-70 family RNA polymerase sigma factor [Alphaproteobacteria bacterium]